MAAPVLLGLGAGLTFFADEWAFIETRSLADPSTWLTPHNEHWSTLPILTYRVLVETVGLGSYMPYLAVLIGLHLVVATLVYTLVRRTGGQLAGARAGVVVLLGSGFENLYWAFQIGFVGSVAAGLAARSSLRRDGPVTARRASRGRAAPGLAGNERRRDRGVRRGGSSWLLDPRRRRLDPAPGHSRPPSTRLVPGRRAREAMASHHGPFSLGGLGDVPPAVVAGFWECDLGACRRGYAAGARLVVGSGGVALASAWRREDSTSLRGRSPVVVGGDLLRAHRSRRLRGSDRVVTTRATRT